jgi:saccharopine dehydrogenase (NAD+, L-lysine forming)
MITAGFRVTVEASEDYAAQLLPVLPGLDRAGEGARGRARAEFDRHVG